MSDSDSLTFDDAIAVARGCFDYSGGHRGDAREIFHHGIQTVVNALVGAKKSGLVDLQSRVLHRIGQSLEQGVAISNQEAHLKALKQDRDAAHNDWMVAEDKVAQAVDELDRLKRAIR